MTTEMQTPRDVLERTYRRALEQADALGVTLAELLPQMLPATAAELRAYALAEYGLRLDPVAAPSFEAWEFHGNGDPFFGGSADDRILYRRPDGSLAMLRSWEAQTAGAVIAQFPTKEAAVEAAKPYARPKGLLSAIEARQVPRRPTIA